ncbi:pyrimidine-nucleoside phosphorylase [Anoxybacter fermentans]|uniref:Pyrimidine-nucleoside phosphorylase n=1 Tax=Anoxybacter fermentans TaxID=1323375 RepID=A0A3S9SYU4_9FIRM|nr:pyrimidine-nucleoside phosphorylase [Anoxybacter fermentans]AZR73430.1 pyrimidine-nucleoside phosphorylase [Anoxybacter fermentans]
MRAVDLIRKKRDGKELTTEEIQFLIKGYTSGEIPDYQMSALAMAIYFQGMTKRETADLTMAMVNSGDQVDLSSIKGTKVDKHSTGGVGDTTTLVLAPLVASCGAPVAKMSGRGLGHTGGTLDKLESIEGFRVSLNSEEFVKNVNEIGVAVVSQTGNLVPADKKLYSLRDVTATVRSIPLIASSIMSKKLAAGANAIVLDVKTGSGAFMTEYEDAKKLAREMVDIGNNLGRKTVAVLTDMDQPLGFAVGNALEVREAIDTLKGEGPDDLYELCLTLGSYMLVLANVVTSSEEGRKKLEESIRTGKALKKLKEMVAAQDGNPEVIDNPDLLPKAKKVVELKAEKSGYVQKIVAIDVGLSAMLLGAGRETKDSQIDLAVGVVLKKKVGDEVKAGEALAELHVNDEKRLNDALSLLKNAFTISDEKPKGKPLIYEVIQ